MEDENGTEWITVDLGRIMTIEMLQIEGSAENWISSFALAYSSDENTYFDVVDASGEIQIFEALTADETTKDIRLEPFQAQFVRFDPVMSNGSVFLRWQLFGCEASGKNNPNAIDCNVNCKKIRILLITIFY